MSRPTKTTAHTIVMSTGKRAAIARQKLARMGIDINDARNGTFLPRPHNSR
ncbi:AHH domain-containing protein [Streptomyces sp. NPDC046900]|uniref:AHH domain-containing protein n=1 Tax=Streptomyces sp. NPDC046900 TaxID=3155473 RepID=UPI0033EDDB6C